MAVLNKLTITLSKTKEMTFHRPGLRGFREPSPIANIERLSSFKLLGVYLSSTLSMELHINYTVSIVNQRLFLLNNLKRQGLPLAARRIVFQALIASRITYALPAFAGFLQWRFYGGTIRALAPATVNSPPELLRNMGGSMNFGYTCAAAF
jgi:hypothetical protein